MKRKGRLRGGRGESKASSDPVVGADRDVTRYQHGLVVHASIGEQGMIMLIADGKERSWRTSGGDNTVTVGPRVGRTGNGSPSCEGLSNTVSV